MMAEIIEGTIFLILVYLVLANSTDFAKVAGAIGTTYTGAVKTLQARA